MSNDKTGSPKLAESVAMDRFIDSLDLLDEPTLMVMVAAWGAISHRDHEAAWAEVRRVADREGLQGEVQEVRERAVRWSYRGSNIPAMPYSLQSEDQWVGLRREAAPALVDAALGIALGDRLDEFTSGVLLGPWISATGRPG
jgi:hypothetical protein